MTARTAKMAAVSAPQMRKKVRDSLRETRATMVRTMSSMMMKMAIKCAFVSSINAATLQGFLFSLADSC